MENDFIQVVEFGNIDYILFNSKQDILDYWKREYLIDSISEYMRNNKNISLQMLLDMAERFGLGTEYRRRS